MRLRFSAYQWAAILGLSATIGFTGCAKESATEAKKEPPVSQTQTVNENDIAQKAVTPVAQSPQLVGVWLGEAKLDMVKLQQKLDQMPPDYRRAAEAKAKSFLSMVMGVDFRADGTVESEVELFSLDGQKLHDGSLGAWKVVSVDGDNVHVENQENLSDGSISINQNVYQFLTADTMKLDVDAVEDLKDCSPQLIFTRQILDQTDVAQGQSTSERR